MGRPTPTNTELRDGSLREVSLDEVAELVSEAANHGAVEHELTTLALLRRQLDEA